MTSCINGDGNPVENRTTGECASCGTARRKAERMKVKEKKPIKKVSDKRKVQLTDYAQISARYLFKHPDCEYHGKGCASQVIHHRAGRVGFVDEYARENQIPALVDERYFCALCHEAHSWVTEHSKEAIELGLSKLRSA